ncbi:MAG: protein subunit release factor A [Chlamydiales bacterium]|jgi:protein subunit release factor A
MNELSNAAKRPKLNPEEIRVEIVSLLGNFLDNRFSHAVRVTHIPTKIVVYRSPFDFPIPKRIEQLKAYALSILELQVDAYQKRKK